MSLLQKLKLNKSHLLADFVVIVLLLIKLHYVYVNVNKHNRNLKAAVSVETTFVTKQDMPCLLYAPGVVAAKNTVAIISQVTAKVNNINFNSGSYVVQGQLLFELDPTPFLANIAKIKAILAKDQATLLQNKTDAVRLAKLAKSDYVSLQQAEQAKTVAEAQQAVVDADLSELKQAEIALGYTKIYAPMDGKAGIVTVNVGDLIIANNVAPLVTINQLDVVLVNFSLTQHQLQNLLNKQQEQMLPVRVFIDYPSSFFKYGTLVFIDNNVDTKTGTFLLQAEINNDDCKLWPGMLVNLELVMDLEHDAMVLPISVIQIDQAGNFVYLLNNNKAVIRRIEVSRKIGGLAVIAKGLIGSEEIIATVSPNLVEGIVVTKVVNNNKD